jgi:hypothetical protein
LCFEYPIKIPILRVFTNELRRNSMNLGTILLIILILMFVGVLPTWPHSANWGYFPSGTLGIIVFVLLILVLMKRI